MNIILYSDDINLLTYWEECFKVEYSICFSLYELIASKNNIIVINYSAFNEKEKEILSLLNDNLNYVLVLDRTPNINKGKIVLSYGAKGYGNALMKKHFLFSAIDTMKENMIWLYPEFTSELIFLLPSKTTLNSKIILDKLTTREKEVANYIKDGNTYKTIANKLNITPRTVKAHAHNIYKKLEIKDRLALALLLK
ncbi:MAG: response regulator transcription factor [Campylobacteraceae bacterium]|nr:response regulator transcription factor [Campylobacteraceae bacterium]